MSLPKEMILDRLLHKIEKLESENARYREALLSISKPDPMFIGGPEAYRYKTIAREALKGE